MTPEAAAPLRLLALHAHPDDESSKGAATLARYADERADVLVVTCTGGERGDVLNPGFGPPAAGITRARRAEVARACEILGVRQEFLGFVDSGMSGEQAGGFAHQPVPTVAAPLVRVVRRFRPHVLVTYDDTGGYPHPDHVMCHRAGMAAFESAGDPDLYPDLGEPWQPLKLYYHVGLQADRLAALENAVRRRGRWHPDHAARVATLRAHDPASRWPVTTRVPCGEYFETRECALAAHESQVDPDGFWFTYPAQLQREAWPTEDYHLARNLAGPVPRPGEPVEDDLFAALRPAELPA